MEPTLEELATKGRDGDRAAVEQLVSRVRHRLYQLSLRVLGDVEEAQDATQEIVVKLVTRLASFRGEAPFLTWAQRVATNHLINVKAGRREGASFEALGENLDQGLAAFRSLPPAPSPLDAAVVEECKLFCTQAMLACLDRDHRLAYVLGEVLELAADEGAAVLEIESATFRKRLSRARERLEAFTQRRCGQLDVSNPCSCEKQAVVGVKFGVFDPAKLKLATHPRVSPAEATRELMAIKSAAQLMRSHPAYAAPDALMTHLRRFLEGSVLAG